MIDHTDTPVFGLSHPYVSSGLPRTHSDAEDRGAAWARNWNNRDVDAVLAHFDDDIVFRSSIAADVVGRGTLKGKAELRAYWVKALARITVLQFTVDRVLWDPDLRELAVLYVAALDGKRRRALERMRLNDQGMVIEADALYGAPLADD